MTYKVVRNRWWAYCCDSDYYRYRELDAPCPNPTKSIQLKDVRAWFDAHLKKMLDAGNPLLLARGENGTKKVDRVSDIQQSIRELNDYVDNLIEQRVKTPQNLQGNLDRKLEQASERLQILEADLAGEMAKLAGERRQVESATNAFKRLSKIGTEAFWELPPDQINEILFALLGGQALAVWNGEIIGTDVAPPRNQSRRRKV